MDTAIFYFLIESEKKVVYILGVQTTKELGFVKFVPPRKVLGNRYFSLGLFKHSDKQYSRLSLSQSQRDPLKHYKISVLRHIRDEELRKIPMKQPNFTNEQCNLTPLVIYI